MADTPELNELQAAHEDLVAKHAALLTEHEALKAQHDALVASLPQPKPEYVYSDNECRPVVPVKGNSCEKCGWTFGGNGPKDHEPHAVKW